MGPAQEKILSSLLTAHRLGRQESLPGRTSIFVYEMIFGSFHRTDTNACS